MVDVVNECMKISIKWPNRDMHRDLLKAKERHANADFVSHQPLPDVPEEIILMMETPPVSPVNATHWTDHDPVLSRIKDMVS